MSRSRLVALGKNLFQNYKKQALIVGCACSCLYIGQRAMSSSNKRGNYVVQEPSRATRKNVENNQKSIREMYINMPIEEKRKLYKCGKKYVLPSAVQDWSSYASAEDLVDKYKFKPKYDVNEDLNSVVCLWRGDITKLEIDGIVNAANNSLLGGGGVDGAIHSAAGWKLREECSTLGGCSTGEAKITAGYNLPATYVIHTVGPIGVNPEKLRNCYINSLNLAVENDAQTVAFPCISTGIYGYDIEKATPVVLKTVREWLCDADNRRKIKKIIFCVFLERDVEVYEQNFLEYFPVQYDKPTSNENEKSKEKKSAQKNKQQDNSKNKASVKDRDKKTDNVKTTKPETDDKGEVVTVNKEEDKNNQALEGQDTENTSSEESKEKLTSKTRNVSEKTVNENGVNTERLSKNKTEHATEDSGNCETKVDVESAEGAGQVGKKTKKAKSGKEEDIVGPAPKKKPGVSLDKFRPPTAVL